MGELRRFPVGDLDPELLEYLLQLPNEKKREVAVAVSRLALRTNGLAEPLTDQVLSALDASQDVLGVTVAGIERRVEELDEVYFDLAAEVDGPDQDGDPGDPRWPEVWAQYRRARAMESLQYACASDPLEAVHEATYNCMAAVDSDFAAVRNAAGYVPGSALAAGSAGGGVADQAGGFRARLRRLFGANPPS